MGVATGAGIAAGDALHTLAAVIGLSAVLMTSALAFDVVKYLGAAYLVYLGIMAFRQPPQSLELPNVRPMTPGRAFRQAILTEVLNPKTALFFLSFLPQFVDAARGGIAGQMAVLGLLFMAQTLVIFGAVALFSGWIGERLRAHPAVGERLNVFAGLTFITLGVRVALPDVGRA